MEDEEGEIIEVGGVVFVDVPVRREGDWKWLDLCGYFVGMRESCAERVFSTMVLQVEVRGILMIYGNGVVCVLFSTAIKAFFVQKSV